MAGISFVTFPDLEAGAVAGVEAFGADYADLRGRAEAGHTTAHLETTSSARARSNAAFDCEENHFAG